MGCFERLGHLKRHLARLRPGHKRTKELNIGEPFAFRKDTNPSQHGFHGEGDPFSSLSDILEERDSLMKEKLGLQHASAISRQQLIADPPSSANSRQPTLYGSSTHLPHGHLRWADGPGVHA
ncbi:MAG: hypothetical protein HETSPECPRED_003154 [Heterodermia speciosa]|uniref:Uncharacterized protein n=1 Tax=Heterodermia speciosa TaxID=116794 RepID=A0A8H3IFX4_9LECA|nr:MAG: hypothetical protein HETSPECPRED_003154 [Heterodermia speciosa]